ACNPCAGTCSPQGSAPVTTVIAVYGEISGGKLKIKHDLCAESVPVGSPPQGSLCSAGAAPLSTYNLDLVCYRADVAYRGAHVPGTFGLQSPNDCMGLINLGADPSGRGADSGGSFPVPANGILARIGESIF